MAEKRVKIWYDKEGELQIGQMSTSASPLDVSRSDEPPPEAEDGGP